MCYEFISLNQLFVRIPYSKEIVANTALITHCEWIGEIRLFWVTKNTQNHNLKQGRTFHIQYCDLKSWP